MPAKPFQHGGAALGRAQGPGSESWACSGGADGCEARAKSAEGLGHQSQHLMAQLAASTKESSLCLMETH